MNIVEPRFLYRCADLLCKLAESMQKEKGLLTPEWVAKQAAGFTADEMRDFGEVLELLALVMHALVITRDSTIEQLTERIVELEKGRR